MAKRTTNAPAGVGRRKRDDIVHTSVYLPEPAYQALRKIAFDKDCKIHDLLMDGVDAVLRRNGYKSLAELRATK